MALRELALRRTADRVEDDVQAYRSDKSIERVWKTEDSLLCCIGPGPGGEDVVRSAARLATQLGVDWTAVYVETPALQRLAGTRARAHPADRQARAGPRRDDRDPRRQRRRPPIVEYARTHNCSKVVVGASAAIAALAVGVAARRSRIGELAPDIDLIEVGRGAAPPGRASRDVATPSGRRSAARRQARCATCGRVAACLATTLVATPLLPLLRSRQHRDAVPADGGAGRAEVGTRPGGAGGVRQRRDVRLLLRAAAVLVRGQRRPVPADVRGDARRSR